MKTVLPLFIMVDACGWEIIRDDPFGRSFAPTRKRLTSVFGYSSACIPSILSGRWPVEHRNWCYFVYDPEHSPFKGLRWLRCLPSAVADRRLFRRWLASRIKTRLNFRGYFDLYNIPFRYISLFDFTEKKSPLAPRGMNQGENIFDFLESAGIPYFVSDPAKTEDANGRDLARSIQAGWPDFAFLYWPGLDALMHRVGNDAPEVGIKLRVYEKWIDELLTAARESYRDVHLYVFSDHGMANCDRILDLKCILDPLPLRMGEHYAAVYDSTMARFWFLTPEAKAQITRALAAVPQGRVLPDEELEELGTLFPDRRFGELIFLVREGVLIVPSHMGRAPLRAMHGYHPEERHSYAALLTNQAAIPEEITAIPDIYRLMVREAELAHASNRKEKAPATQAGEPLQKAC